MNVKYLLLLMCVLIFENCGSYKNNLIRIGGKESAIQNAILDFTNTSRLYKKGTVFSVSVLKIIDNEDLLIVRIGKNGMKILLTESSKIGSKGKMPSRYIEKEGKLFFWWDDDYILTKEALTVFSKYLLLQDDEGGTIVLPDSVLDDAQKAVHYYFCKNDLSKYKKVTTNIGVVYYNAPNLNCSH